MIILYKGKILADSYPKFFQTCGYSFPLKYVFDTANECDGITVRKIPSDVVLNLKPEAFEWLVDGF